MDSSTLLRRTPAGDAEVAVPAKGLSLTQRRILTLLDTPARLGDLPVGAALDAVRLQREAVRLAQAGLVASEAPPVPAAADAHCGSDARVAPLARSVAALFVAIAAVALAWGGWRLVAVPVTGANTTTHPLATGNVAAANAAAPAATADPPVIATRVLRGDPTDRSRDSVKDSHAPAAAKRPATASADSSPDAADARLATRVSTSPAAASKEPATRDGH